MSRFDITAYTDAPLKMSSIIDFEGYSCQQVFDIMGDPDKIPEWYLLAKEVKIHDSTEGEKPSFNVEFTFFGDVFEEILFWDAPNRYVYKATGKDFPITDYIAEIYVESHGKNVGKMTWNIYYSKISGEHFQKILPIILPVINRKSMERLSPLIGGKTVSVIDHS